MPSCGVSMSHTTRSFAMGGIGQPMAGILVCLYKLCFDQYGLQLCCAGGRLTSKIGALPFWSMTQKLCERSSSCLARSCPSMASTFSNSTPFEMYAKAHLLLRVTVIRNICQKFNHFLESRARTWDCGAMGREVAGL